MVAGNPAELRQRMINRGLGIDPAAPAPADGYDASRAADDDEISDDDFISDDDALAGLRGITDPDDLWSALECLPESQCARMLDLLKASL
jgi:hypothetical protein